MSKGGSFGNLQSRVIRAKGRAVGGRRKRCKKGKSCSAACIERNDLCLIDLPSGSSSTVPKVIRLIRQVKPTKELRKEYDSKVKGLLKEIEGALKKGKVEGPLGKLKSLHSKVGATLGKEFPKDKVDFILSGKFLLPGGPAPKLPKLQTEEDFKKVRKETAQFSLPFHDRFTGILKIKDKSPGATAERQSVLGRLGISEASFTKIVKMIRGYTDWDYKEVKAAQYAKRDKKPLTESMKASLARAKAIESLIAAMPKEAVVKFRGFRYSEDRLQALIQSAKLKGEFKDGALTSWSTSLRVAKEFADKEKEGRPVRVLFQTVNKRGIPIEGITNAEKEMEMLTSGSARYVHTGNYRVVRVGDQDYHIFDIVES